MATQLKSRQQRADKPDESTDGLTPLDHLCRTTRRAMSTILPCSRVDIVLLDGSDRILLLKEDGALPFPRREWLASESDAYIINDLESISEKDALARWLAEKGMCSSVALPVEAEGKVFALVSSDEKAAYPDEDGTLWSEAIELLSRTVDERLVLETLMHVIAEMARTSIAGSEYLKRLEEEAKRKEREFTKLQEKYRLILEVSRTITSSLNLDQIFHEVVSGVGRIFRFDRASLVLYEESNQSFHIFALEVASRRYMGSELVIPKERSNMGWVFENGQYYINPDVTSNCRSIEDEYLIKRGIKSYIVLPLIHRGRVIGMFNLGRKIASAYSATDAELLMHIASQIATAVENVRAYEAVEEVRDSLYGENIYLKEEVKTVYNFDEIIGTSAPLRRVLSDVEKVAPTECTVLIRGETGTGKELIARAIHNLGARKEKPFVRINCAAVPEGLIESELFGHERGAFTGAFAQKIGLFEVANGGTILLDEIGDISSNMQAKILRVLEEREFVRLGATRTTRVDLRIVASTNRDLEAAIEEGRFRADLFYRLTAFPICAPPLRERREDIPMLVNYFLSKYSKLMNKQIEGIDRSALKSLTDYDWPGNVRELENVIERAVILCESKVLQIQNPFRSSSVESGPAKSASEPSGPVLTLAELERAHIIEVLKMTGGRIYGKDAAASILGLKPTTLQSRIKKLGIRKVQSIK